jgi:acetylornithine deacetylase/succinyl-diaminopimelate desuccinylase-like protein
LSGGGGGRLRECSAGHAAGLSAAGLRAALGLVRTETGVSHSPDERVDLEDAAFGAEMLLLLMEELAP